MLHSTRSREASVVHSLAHPKRLAEQPEVAGAIDNVKQNGRQNRCMAFPKIPEYQGREEYGGRPKRGVRRKMQRRKGGSGQQVGNGSCRIFRAVRSIDSGETSARHREKQFPPVRDTERSASRTPTALATARSDSPWALPTTTALSRRTVRPLLPRTNCQSRRIALRAFCVATMQSSLAHSKPLMVGSTGGRHYFPVNSRRDGIANRQDRRDDAKQDEYGYPSFPWSVHGIRVQGSQRQNDTDRQRGG